MAPRSWRRTVDIECRDFPAGTVSADIVQWVWDFLANSYPDFKVASIQQASGRVARITFDRDCVDGKETIENLGEVTINGVQCLVVKPEPAAPQLQNVLVYQYPFEFPNESVASFLDKFGAVKSVSHQHWTHLPDVCTGTRIVRMVVDKDIPRFIFVRGIRCKVWYRDQPLQCDICSKLGHKASACPDKGKCLRCHNPGHVARHCPTPWGSAGRASNTADAGGSGNGTDAGVAGSSDPVTVDPDALMPPGDLSQGLQHADDLDAGFPQLPAGSGESERDLAAAASVAEAALAFSSQDSDVIVVDEGNATPSVSSLTVMDERFNQLDEIASQASISILTNCGPVGAPSGGELSASQIVSDSSLNLSNDNDSVSNLDDNNNSQSNLSLDNINNVNCYGSVVGSDGALSGPPIADSEMSHSSDPRKRPISEASSDDASGRVLDPKNLSKKSKKGGQKSRVPVASAPLAKKGGSVASATQSKSVRLPSGVVSAVRLAVSRSVRK